MLARVLSLNARQWSAAAQNPLRSGQHARHASHFTSSDTEYRPLPPNTLPTRSFSNRAPNLRHSSDLADVSATFHDIASLFTDLSLHSPIASTLHESADRFATRLRMLLQERYQSEHLSSVLYGNASVPNLGWNPPGSNRFSAPYPSPRRMSSQPSPLRASNPVAPAGDVAENFDGPRLRGGSGYDYNGNRLPQDPYRGWYHITNTPSPTTNFAANVREVRPHVQWPSLPPVQYPASVPPGFANQPPPASQIPSRPLVWNLTVPGHGYFGWQSWIIKSRHHPLWHQAITPYNNPGFAAIINNVPVHHVMMFERCFHGDPWGPVRYVVSQRQESSGKQMAEGSAVTLFRPQTGANGFKLSRINKRCISDASSSSALPKF